MKITVRVQFSAVPPGEEGAEQVSEVFVLERDQLTEASAGLSLAEAHALLASIQEAMVCAQATAAVAGQRCCARCGRPYRHKDTRTIVVRTLFGTLHLDSPRFMACRCRPDAPQEPGDLQPAGRDTAQFSRSCGEAQSVAFGLVTTLLCGTRDRHPYSLEPGIASL